MIRNVALYAILLSFPFIQCCTPKTSHESSTQICPYTLAYVNFSGSDVKLTYGNNLIFDGFISLGDESTGLNFTQKISVTEDSQLNIIVDGNEQTIEVKPYCNYDVVYIQPYEPFLRLTDDTHPIVF